MRADTPGKLCSGTYRVSASITDDLYGDEEEENEDDKNEDDKNDEDGHDNAMLTPRMRAGLKCFSLL